MAKSGPRKSFVYLISALIISGVFFVIRPSAAYTTHRPSQIQVGNDQHFSFFKNFEGGASVASADVNGDGVDEYIVGAGPTGGPRVSVINQSGAETSTFFAYDKNNRDGIDVAAGDLDGDGVAEIITAPLAGSKPTIKVFTFQGKLLRSFGVFEANFVGGLNIAVIAAHGDDDGYIVVGSGFGREAEVRVYTGHGAATGIQWLPLGKVASNGVNVAGGWSDEFNQSVVVVGAGQGQAPLVQVYGLTSKEKVAQWIAYDRQIKSGVRVGYRDDIIVTGPGAGGGPDMRTFTIRGSSINSQLIYEPVFRGGLDVAFTSLNNSLTTIAVPTAAPTTANSLGKKVVINLSRQNITMYEKGRLVSVRKISSGKWSTPTPTGKFAVRNKIPVAYSRAYGLYMENWMAFSADGKYGLHALPFWKLKAGGKLYEGAAHIGTPVSHGCVRQTVVESKSLYDWVTIGTPVIIEK